MKAVNLIPADGRRSRGSLKVGSLGPAHALIGLLSVAVLFTFVYVLSGNTVSERTAKLAGLKAQVAQVQAEATSLATYTSFEQLAQHRSATVREIVGSRFDWDKALSELSRVVPADTSLQSLLGTVVPGVNIGGTGAGAGTGSLRTAIQAPAFEMRGCTRNQDEVAGLMSRLRLINDVTRVTLVDSQKSGSATGAVGAGTGSSAGCPSSWPTFDLVVFFTPVPGAGAAGPASAPGAGTASAAPTTPVSSVATTPSATPPGATTPGVPTTSTSTPAPGASSSATPTQAAQGTVTTTATPGATK